MSTLEMNIAQVNSDFQAIRTAIVDAGVDIADGTSASAYAGKISAVHEAGKQAEYDAFWDAYQQNGKRDAHDFAFGGAGWNNALFRPKYDIRPVGAAYMMFRHSQITGDLVEILQDLGIVLDTSTTNSLQYCFSATRFTRVGIIDARGCTGYASFLGVFMSSSQIHTIDRLIVSDEVEYINAFSGATALVNLTIEGTIGKSGFDVGDSARLSKESIRSVITALSDATTGLTVTLSIAAVNSAFETSEDAADGSTSAEWLALADTKSNWTISLV